MSDSIIGTRREALGWLAGGGVVATALLAVDRARGADNEVKLADVPKAVKEAAGRVVPGAEWIWAGKIDQDGKTAFELDGKDDKKRDVTVTVTADGKVVECETELKDATNVPKKVLDAVKKKWPHFTAKETQEIRQGEDLTDHKDGDYVYDMRGALGSKERDITVQVTADGEILESTVEVALDRVPKVVLDALKEKRSKFQIGTAYAVRKKLDKKEELIAYHFEGEGAKGRDLTISVTPDGKRVEVIE